MTTGPEAVTPNASSSNPPRLSWPPPGMESVQGRLPGAVGLVAFGDLVLVLPLLLSVLPYQHFLSLGTFGGGWWVPIATSVLGAVVVAAGIEKLVRLCAAAARMAREGYGWRLMLHVLADGERDAGFLLQGLRHFDGVAPGERGTILSVRAMATLAYAVAVLWAPFGFSLSVLLAALGVAGPGAIWTLAIIIPLILVVAGALLRFASGLMTRAVRRGKPAAPDLRTEIADWTSRFDAVAAPVGFHAGSAGRHRAFYGAAAVAIVLAVLAILPALGLTASGGIGAVIASLATPRFGRTQAKLVKAEVLRPYVLPADPSVSPEVAGDALHALEMVGNEAVPLMRAPARVYDAWDTPVPEGIAAQVWVLDAMGRARGGLTPAEREILRAMAAHPAHTEFATVAAAEAIDVVGSRYTLPFPEATAPWTLPIPRFSGIRQGAVAHLGLAALDLSEGRLALAERRIQEVITVGFAYIDDAPLLIDNLIGVVLANTGGDALVAFYGATGRSGEAERIETLREYVELAGTRATDLPMAPNTEAMMRAMPRIVTDTTFVLGLRWEFFGSVNAFAGCLNLHTLVFGPGQEYDAWRAEAREALVRRPSDEALFDLMSRGLFGVQGCGTPFERVRLLRTIY